ncbi:MAG: Zn-dependent hydrolase [Ectothiorhodospiraceae bacterium]|nr:Zn-dependent hydrolase [Ectothiorhodospiraceae bacterium]
MARINADRLLADLDHLRSFGACGNGVVRTSLSPVDMEARHWLATRMREAGFEATIDGVGNVIGRSPNPGPALLVGSHSDTQPQGGWLDGALGVIYGLEIARALLEDPATADLAVDPVSWIDEEGTFLGCLGSRSWCGVLDPKAEAAARNAAGTSLADALAAADLVDRPRARMEPGRYLGYLEAHIEQGPYLEEAGLEIGVVTSIVGIRGCTVRFEGEQNHAGTTPMPRRRDAGVALFDYAVRIRERFQALAGDRTVWTIGRATLDPGAPSIIPGRAEMMLQFRDADVDRLDRMEAAAEALAAEATAAGPVKVTCTRARAPVAPTIMDAGFQQHIADAAERIVPGRWMRMPSAAGHDPMVVAHHIPCAMVFIPSIDGISHDFAEDSKRDDIVTGCRVLADAAESILRAGG